MPYRKNVYILGAGASAEAGAPVLRDFLDRAQGLYLDPRAPLAPEERDRFRKVFQYQKRMDLARAHVEMDLDNLEDLFGLVDLQCRIGNEQAKDVRECLTFLIQKTLMVTTRPDSQAPQDYVQFAALAARRGQHQKGGSWRSDPKHQGARDSVVTLNYDTVFESALKEIELSPDYMLPDSPSGWERFPVLKLHGSINWLACTFTGCGHAMVGRVKPAIRCPLGTHHEMGPFIVPPTWDKGSGNKAISEIWAAAHKELVEAHRWIIIGYSAPPSDRFFQYLLGSARAENEHLETVAVFNYAKDEAGQRAIRERYERLFTKSFVDRRLQLFLTSRFPGSAMNVLKALVNGD
jgi:hypothetical protein